MRFFPRFHAAEPPAERPYIMRISLLTVTITWSESPLRTHVSAPFGSWCRADLAVAEMAARVPLGADHRTGVAVVWLDGQRYVAQIPLRRYGPGSALQPLSQVIRAGLEETAGRRCPKQLDPAQCAAFFQAQEPEVRARAARLLDIYDVG